MGPGCCYKSFQNEDFKGSLSSSYWYWGCQITGKKLATSCVDIMRKALRWLTDKIIIIINNTVPFGVNRVCVCFVLNTVFSSPRIKNSYIQTLVLAFWLKSFCCCSSGYIFLLDSSCICALQFLKCVKTVQLLKHF